MLFIVSETKLENKVLVVLYYKTGRSELTLVRLVLSKVGPTGPEGSKMCHDENHIHVNSAKPLANGQGFEPRTAVSLCCPKIKRSPLFTMECR